MSDLYRELILEHWRNPRHAVPLERPTHVATVINEACGDSARVELQISPRPSLKKRGNSSLYKREVGRDLVGEEVLADVSIQVSGCALATAAGSVLAERIVGQSVEDARSFDETIILKLLGGIDPAVSRRRCVTLALEAMQKVLAEISPAPRR